MSLVDIPKNHSLIQTKLQEYGHGSLAVKFVLADSPTPRPQAFLAETPPAARPSPPRQPAAQRSGSASRG